MSTAQSIVNDSLRLLNQLSNINDVDPYMQQQGFYRLVDYLNAQREEDIYLTPQIPASINQELSEKPWAKMGITYDLAFYLAPYIQVKEYPSNFFDVRTRLSSELYVNAKPPTEQQYPETLPIGGGNEWYENWSYRFYSFNDRTRYDIYEEQNINEAAFYVADFDADAVKRGTTVSSVVWEVTELYTTTISEETLSGNVAMALVTFGGGGVTTFRARATYANGEIQDFNFQVRVNGGIIYA